MVRFAKEACVVLQPCVVMWPHGRSSRQHRNLAALQLLESMLQSQSEKIEDTETNWLAL